MQKAFIAVPLKIQTGSPAVVRTALLKIDGVLGHEGQGAPTSEEQIALWTNLQEFSRANLHAIQGQTGQAGATG